MKSEESVDEHNNNDFLWWCFCPRTHCVSVYRTVVPLYAGGWVALSVPPQFSSLHNLQSEKALSAVICFIAVTSFFDPIFSQVDFYFHQSSLSPTLSIRPTVESLVRLFTLLASHLLLQPIAFEHALILFLVLNHALSLPVLIF